MKKREIGEKKKNHPSEPQKPNIEAEAYNNNKKCEWEKKKKKKAQNLVRFHSANKIDNYNRGGKKKKKKKKNPKEYTEQVKTWEW